MDLLYSIIDANAGPYETLCSLSTLLVIAEDQPISIEPIVTQIKNLLDCEAARADGDVVVVASRIIATLLEQSAKKNVRTATSVIQQIGLMVKGLLLRTSDESMRFHHCNANDLIEELLRCFSASASMSGTWGSVFPTASERASLCIEALKRCLWTCLPQALKILSTTAVSPHADDAVCSAALSAATNFVDSTLQTRPLDATWDALFPDFARFVILSSFSKPSDHDMFARLVALTKRIASLSPGSRRLRLVLATTAAYADNLDSRYVVLDSDVVWICSFLASERQEVNRTASFRNPYVARVNEHEHHIPTRVSENEWTLESAVSSGLALLARLLAVPVKSKRMFLWAWHREGNSWAPFSRNNCGKLTRALRLGALSCEITSSQEQYAIDLKAFAQRNIRTSTSRQVLFQPVPWCRETVWEPVVLSSFTLSGQEAALAACRPHLEHSDTARIVYAAALVDTYSAENQLLLQKFVTEYFDEVGDPAAITHFISACSSRDPRWKSAFRECGLVEGRRSATLDAAEEKSDICGLLRGMASPAALNEALSHLPTVSLNKLQREALTILCDHITSLQPELSTRERALKLCSGSPSTLPTCSGSHELSYCRFRHWTCDLCNVNGHGPVLACVACNYDLCTTCATKKFRTIHSHGYFSFAQLGHVEQTYFSSEQVFSTCSSLGAVPEYAILHYTTGTDTACTLCQTEMPLALCDASESVGRVLRNAVACLAFAVTGEQEFSHAIERTVVSMMARFAQSFLGRGLRMAAYVMELCKPLLRLSVRRDAAIFCSVDNQRYFSGAENPRTSRRRCRSFTVKRETILDEVRKVLCVATVSDPVEFTFADEVGTGNGPTQEAYNLLCSSFGSTKHLWSDSCSMPFPSKDQVFASDFFLLGCCFAKAFADGFTLSLPLHPAAWMIPQCGTDQYMWSWQLLEGVDSQYATLLRSLHSMSSHELSQLELFDDENTELSQENVERYIQQQVLLVCANWRANLQQFHRGLSKYVNLEVLRFFFPSELESVFCGDSIAQHALTAEDLAAVVVGAHGYATDSNMVQRFIRVVVNLTHDDQVLFLEFLTGSPRLPHGGLRSLGKPITVVKKDFEGPKEQTLPSCNTCFLYIKVPPYSSEQILRDRLITAIREGRSNFGLS